MHGIQVNLKPKFHPYDASLTDKVIIAASQSSSQARILALKIMEGVFAREENLADEDVIVEKTRIVELDPDDILERDNGEIVTEIYDKNTLKAAELGVFGLLSYVLDGKNFWRQDRLEMMEAAIKEDCSPFVVD